MRSYFAPDDFAPTDKNREWAMKEFRITSEEVDRQVCCMIDHEFRRKYSDWQRVFRNWIRKAEQIESLRRERTLRQPQERTDEEKAEDIRKWKEEMKRFGVVK